MAVSSGVCLCMYVSMSVCICVSVCLRVYLCIICVGTRIQPVKSTGKISVPLLIIFSWKLYVLAVQISSQHQNKVQTFSPNSGFMLGVTRRLHSILRWTLNLKHIDCLPFSWKALESINRYPTQI